MKGKHKSISVESVDSMVTFFDATIELFYDTKTLVGVEIRCKRAEGSFTLRNDKNLSITDDQITGVDESGRTVFIEFDQFD